MRTSLFGAIERGQLLPDQALATRFVESLQLAIFFLIVSTARPLVLPLL